MVDELTDGEKYSLLKHHRRPPANLLPATSLAGCMRSFQTSCLSEYPWMVYSRSTATDGAFCMRIPCALFCRNRATKGQFVTPLFATGKRRARSVQIIKAPNHTRSRLKKRIRWPFLPLFHCEKECLSVPGTRRLFWVVLFFLLAVGSEEEKTCFRTSDKDGIVERRFALSGAFSVCDCWQYI